MSIPVWEREGEALGVPPGSRSDPTNDGTLEPSEADERPARGRVRQRASGNERGKSARRSAQETPHPQERAEGPWDRVRQSGFPARLTLLLIVTRMGRDYRPGSPTANRAGRPKGSPHACCKGARLVANLHCRPIAAPECETSLVAGLHRFFARRGMTRKKRPAMRSSRTGPTS